jgi:ATP-dependent exoDNAse (exonuclease V) alpha subunit
MGMSKREVDLKVFSALESNLHPETGERITLRANNTRREWWINPETGQEGIRIVDNHRPGSSAFKNKSVVHELDIAGELLRATGGAMRFSEALEFAKSSAFIHLDDQGHVTTEAVRQEERDMLATVQAGQDQHAPLFSDQKIRDPQVALAADQAAAVKFVLESRDQVMDVSGVAGAGKTTMLREVVPAIRNAGHNVILLAPTSASQLNLQKDFPAAITLQRFQSDFELHRELSARDVIILDEVSMVSVPQLARLATLVKQKSARLLTLGDSDQHHSVERGDAIRILQESGSVRSVHLTETYRAQAQYLKDTVLDLKAGRREEGYARLEEHGDIREVQDLDELRQQAVDTHLEAVRAGHLAILASPVHAEARAAAAIVRETLKAEGLITKEDHKLARLVRLELEGLELRDPLHYQPGKVIVFHTKAKGGFKAGQKWEVCESLAGGRFKLRRDSVTRDFDPSQRGKWNVYETAEILLSVGDQVRVTEGFRELGQAFHNNDIACIAAIDGRTITLDDGRVMAKDFVHLDQGVCITSHASQCRTVRQIVALVPIQSFAQIDSKTFYVLASRATHRAVFYTDCKDALKDAVIRPGDRETVWDYEKDLHWQPRLPKALIDLQPEKRVKYIAIADLEVLRAYEHQQRAQEMEVQR